ncbi:hypothetical protein H4R33_003935 [Dimargaris cristalligena]|nr:hypothetical protein H4R33_003935 [Dimargaris cristalligena]
MNILNCIGLLILSSLALSYASEQGFTTPNFGEFTDDQLSQNIERLKLSMSPEEVAEADLMGQSPLFGQFIPKYPSDEPVL